MKNTATLFTVLLCTLFSFSVMAQKTISGVVKAAQSGEPLPGVAVKEKGTNNATVTNFDGKFDLQVASENPVLVFSSMGMKTKEVPAGNSDFLVVNMDMDETQLEEVVVTALGVSKEKRSLGYAVTNLGGEDIKKTGEQNVIQSLAAKAPGVQVIGSGGTPGASSRILIRGASTITGENQPLIVIDGVPIDNTTYQSSPRDYPFNENLQGVNNSNRAIDINPDDIESVTVLKGPAAAALYGQRAGNGAIIYTTKRGKLGKKGLGVKVSSSVEISQVNKMPDLHTTYAAGDWDANGNPQYVGPADPGPDGIGLTDDDIAFGTPLSWGPRISSDPSLQSYDNIDEFFRNGVAYNNSVEVTGGSDRSSFRLSVADLRQSGIVPNSEFNRTSVRLTADTKLSEKVKVGATANFINSDQLAPQNGSNLAGIMLGLTRTPPSYDLSDYYNAQGFQKTYYVVYDNPYYTAYENPFESNVNRIMGNAYLSWIISDEWDFTYRLGIDNYADQRTQVFAISSFGDDIGGLGQINENRLSNRQIYGDALLTYKKDITDKISFSGTLGHNFFTTRFDDLFSRGREMTIPYFYNLSNTSDLYASRYTEVVKTQALFFDLNFEYDNWLFVGITGRNEWSSTFEVDEKNNFFYPSANVSVVFSELMGDLPDWFSFGKVRYSYAQVGISPAPYNTRTYYNVPTYTDGFTNGITFPYNNLNGTPTSGYAISNTLGNRGLKPERLIGNEWGINLNFWQNLLDVDYTYYRQKSVDVLLFQPVAPSSGYISNYTNSAEILNQGHELAVTFNPIRDKEWTWSITANWYKNISEVLKLAGGVDEVQVEAAFASIGSYAIVGEPLGVFYGTRYQRDGAGNVLVNANGVPLIDPVTGNVGSPLPDWQAGLRNTFTWNNWELSFFFDFRKGGSIWNGTYARLNNFGRTSESAENRDGGFNDQVYLVEGVYAPGTTDGQGNDISGQQNSTYLDAYTYFRTVVGDAGGAAEAFVEDVDWVRLRDLSLGYRFDFSDKNWGVEYLNLNFTARNLWLSTNYKGVDPETSLTGAGSNIGGLDYFNNPGTRSYMFGLSFGF